jgi:PEGA domain
MQRLNVWLLCMAATAGAAQGAPVDSAAVVAVGQCDAAGGIAARSFRATLSQKMRTGVQSEVDTARPFGGLSDRTVPQINSAVSSARSDFYSDKIDDATRTLQAALDDSTRIAPSDARWAAEREVLTLLAQMQVKSNQASAESALMRIFRVEPDYRPDSSLFPPSFQRFADTVRKAAKKRSTVRFEVTTSPTGKPVYVGGRRVGVGPVTLRVPPGEYRVEVDWGRRGQARLVTVPSPPVELSASLEGAVSPDGGPCIGGTQDVASALARAAPLVNASRLYGVHIDTKGDTSFAVVTSVDASGGALREARVRLQPGAPSTEALALLAGYAATDNAVPPVEVTRPVAVAPAVSGPPPVAVVAPPPAVVAPAAAAAPASPPPAPPETEKASDRFATKFELAFRVGVSLPLGTAVSGDQSPQFLNGATSLVDYASFLVPIGVDVGVRIGGVVFVGGYFQYGLLGSPNGQFCTGPPPTNTQLSCSSSTVRVGGEILIHPLGNAPVDPWFGVGSGFEWLTLSESTNTVNASFSGFEFFNLQLGIDFALGSVVRLGPYASFSMGSYTSFSPQPTAGTDSATHEWLTFGVRFVILP